MNEIITTITKPEWLFSVVVVSTAINLLSSYLRSWLDGFWSKHSSRRRMASEKKRTNWVKRVDAARSSNTEYTSQKLEAISYKQRGIVLLHLATLSMVACLLATQFETNVIMRITTLVTLLGACFFIFGAHHIVTIGDDIESALMEAQKQMREATPNNSSRSESASNTLV